MHGFVGAGRYDAAVADVDVANLTVDAVGGIVDLTAGKLDQHGRMFFRGSDGGFEGGKHVDGARQACGAAEIAQRQRDHAVAAHELPLVIDAGVPTGI